MCFISCFVHSWSCTWSCWSPSQLWGEGYRYSLDKSAVNQTDTWRQTILSTDNQGCQSARHARLWTCGRHRQNNPTHDLLVARWLRWPLHHSNPLPHHLYSKSCSPFKATQEYYNPGTFEPGTGLTSHSQLCCLWYQLKTPTVFALSACHPYK